MKGTENVPEGFDLTIGKVYNPDSLDLEGSILSFFGISNERGSEITGMIIKAFDSATGEDKKIGKYTLAIPCITEISEQCKTPTELALAMYAFGGYLAITTGRSGGPKINVLKVELGGLQAGNVEEDPIKKIIRESEEINGKPGESRKNK